MSALCRVETTLNAFVFAPMKFLCYCCSVFASIFELYLFRIALFCLDCNLLIELFRSHFKIVLIYCRYVSIFENSYIYFLLQICSFVKLCQSIALKFISLVSRLFLFGLAYGASSVSASILISSYKCFKVFSGCPCWLEEM